MCAPSCYKMVWLKILTGPDNIITRRNFTMDVEEMAKKATLKDLKEIAKN